MSDISTSTARTKQVEKTIKTFLTAFDQPVGFGQTREQFTAVFHPEIQWRNHAFLVCRVGHEAAIGLNQAWLRCNKPFKTELKAIQAIGAGCVAEVLWVGCQQNNIVRPDGEIAVQASGKSFQCQVCMVVEIDEDGKITKIDEYYNKSWDDGIREDEYAVMRGASIKAKK